MGGNDQQMCLVCFSVNCMEQDAYTGDLRCAACGMVSQDFREEDTEGDGGGIGAAGGAVGMGGGLQAGVHVRESNLAMHQQREDVARADAARAAQAVSLSVQAQALSEHYCRGLQRMLALQCHALSTLLLSRHAPAPSERAHSDGSERPSSLAVSSVAQRVLLRLVRHSAVLHRGFAERCWLLWRAGQGTGAQAGGMGGDDGEGGEAEEGRREEERGGREREVLEREMAGWGMGGRDEGLGGDETVGAGAGGRGGEEDEWARELRGILEGRRRSSRRERAEERKRGRQGKRRKHGRFEAELAAIREDEEAERGRAGDEGEGMGEGEEEEEEDGEGWKEGSASEKASMRETWFALSEKLQTSPFFAVANKLQMHLPLHSTLASLFLACHYLRLPLLPTDICHLALSGSLPYLSAWRQLAPFQGYPSAVPPASLFRPLALSSARLLELLAAKTAASIGLQLPPTNYRLLGERFLEELHLPVPLFAPFLHRLFDLLCPSPSLSTPMPSLLPRFHLSPLPSAWPTRLYVMAAVITSLNLALAVGSWPSLTAAPASSTAPSSPSTVAACHPVGVSASPRTRARTRASDKAAVSPAASAAAVVGAAGASGAGGATGATGGGSASAAVSAAAVAPRATVSLARGAVSGWRTVARGSMADGRRAGGGGLESRGEGGGEARTEGVVGEGRWGGGEDEWDVARMLKAVEGSRQQLLMMQTQAEAGAQGGTRRDGGAAGRAPLQLHQYLSYCQRHLFAPDATLGSDGASLERDLKAHLHSAFHCSLAAEGVDGDQRGGDGGGKERDSQAHAMGGRGVDPGVQGVVAGRGKGSREEREKEEVRREGGEGEVGERERERERARWFPVRLEDVEADMRRCDFIMAPALPHALRGSEMVYYERPKARTPFYEVHADLFVLLRAAARVARVHVRALHLCVMEVEDALLAVEVALHSNH